MSIEKTLERLAEAVEENNALLKKDIATRSAALDAATKLTGAKPKAKAEVEDEDDEEDEPRKPAPKAAKEPAKKPAKPAVEEDEDDEDEEETSSSKAAKKPASKPAAKPAPKKKKGAPTNDDVRAAFGDYLDIDDGDERDERKAFVLGVVKRLGAERVGEISEENRQQALDWLNAKIDDEDFVLPKLKKAPKPPVDEDDEEDEE